MKRKRIDHWHDGDSGYFTDGTPFRLANVRAPEKHQFGGSKATRTAAGMTSRSNGYVNVQVVGKSYGRSVVTMSNGDGSINTRLRRKGYWNKGR
ncbi:nuclease [Candidatus Woesearchaeota archaeon]|nr:MAG: nuclease [Candidatus Woesearchaeota archaeon]